jgi:hypothetical protein
MAGAKRRSPTSTLVTKHSIQNAGSALGGLPEKPKEIWSLREAIDALKDEITLALDRGYTYPEISQMLTTRGVEISASTLKYYLSSVKRQDPNAKPRRRRRTLGAGISADSLNLGVMDAAPKKRGRTPGSKNLTPAEKAAAAATKVPGKRGRVAKVKPTDEPVVVKTRKPRGPNKSTLAKQAAAAAAGTTKATATKKTTADTTKATATKKTATKVTATKKTAVKAAATKKTAVKAPKVAKAPKAAKATATATKAKTGVKRGRPAKVTA